MANPIKIVTYVTDNPAQSPDFVRGVIKSYLMLKCPDIGNFTINHTWTSQPERRKYRVLAVSESMHAALQRAAKKFHVPMSRIIQASLYHNSHKSIPPLHLVRR